MAGSQPQFRRILLVGPALALSALFSRENMWLCSLVAISTLGVPHGALDGEVARGLLHPRLGLLWFPVFALPYVALTALVLVAWQLAPMGTLAAFLAASTWHFGSEDAPTGGFLDVLVRGGLPIAISVLTQPTATADIFAVVAGLHFNSPPVWLSAASLCWLGLAVFWIGLNIIRNRIRFLAADALLVCMFVALPPLLAFAIYFICIHAPAHTTALIRNPSRAPRVHDLTSAALLSLPITVLTWVIGAALWPIYSGPIPVRLLSLTLQLLAALTLPHLLLDAWLARRERLDASVCYASSNTPILTEAESMGAKVPTNTW